MGDIKKSKFFVGIIIPILAFFLMSHNAAAIIPVTTRTVMSLTFREDSTTATPVTVNSINQNSSSPIIQRQNFSTQSYDVFTPTFNLNNSVSLSYDTKFMLVLEINTSSTSVFSNPSDRPIYFHCPQGDWSQQIWVEECNIKSSESIDYEWTATGTTGQASYDENSFALVSGKNYIVEIVVYYANDEARTFNNIPLLGRFLTFYNGKQLPMNASWQLNYITVTSFKEEKSDAAKAIEEQNAKENAAVDNIDNQSANDMGGSSNQQTTSIIGTISSFLSAFQNVQPAQNCNLTLPFPEFLGGNTNVNICQGKDKAPTLVTIGSSLLLIVTFVPLAFIMLRMIYSEIRSFTNG